MRGSFKAQATQLNPINTMKAFRTVADAKAALRQDLLTQSKRKRIEHVFQKGDADCACGQTSGIRAVGFTKSRAYYSSIAPICKNCG